MTIKPLLTLGFCCLAAMSASAQDVTIKNTGKFDQVLTFTKNKNAYGACNIIQTDAAGKNNQLGLNTAESTNAITLHTGEKLRIYVNNQTASDLKLVRFLTFTNHKKIAMAGMFRSEDGEVSFSSKDPGTIDAFYANAKCEEKEIILNEGL